MFNKVITTALILIVVWMLWQRFLDQRHIERLQKENTTMILNYAKKINSKDIMIKSLKEKIIATRVIKTGAMDDPTLIKNE
jgi:hypothetical protein